MPLTRLAALGTLSLLAERGPGEGPLLSAF